MSEQVVRWSLVDSTATKDHPEISSEDRRGECVVTSMLYKCEANLSIPRIQSKVCWKVLALFNYIWNALKIAEPGTELFRTRPGTYPCSDLAHICAPKSLQSLQKLHYAGFRP